MAVTAVTEDGATTRVRGLQEAVAAARGRLPADIVDRAAVLATRASERLAMSGGHTVVALAGATGSGKSSMFNALIGMEFSAVGVRRPTTSWTLSCVYGDDAAAEGLLDWLGVPPRHRLSRDSMLDPDPQDEELEGLVLLDLPDHDSTEAAHREQMERMIQLADLVVWVLDPQKYADAALHERFLEPLAQYEGSMLVVLNHIDEVPVEGRVAVIDDLYRLLAADGLPHVEVLPTSAKYGEGIGELRRIVTERVVAKTAATTRFVTDIEDAARSLDALTGNAKTNGITDEAKAKLVDSFSDAVGLPVVLRTVDEGMRRDASRLTGWPVARLLSSFRRDPLKRLAFELGVDAASLTPGARLRTPEANQVQHARVETAVRDVADAVTQGLPQPWASAIRRASVSGLGVVGPAMDEAIGRIDVGMRRVPGWWRVASVVQWLALLVLLGGIVWFVAWELSDSFDWGMSRPAELAGVPLPAVLATAGLVVGILLALVARALNERLIRQRAEAAADAARSAIGDVVTTHVIEPMGLEVDAFRRTQVGLAAALG